jgi:hypothetical protein
MGRNVRYWHKADITLTVRNVRFWGKSGHRRYIQSFPSERLTWAHAVFERTALLSGDAGRAQ